MSNQNCSPGNGSKASSKGSLQAEVGLPIDRNIPVIGFVGRLEEQKGSDILAEAIPQFIRENVQIIVLVRIKLEIAGQSSNIYFLLVTISRGFR